MQRSSTILSSCQFRVAQRRGIFLGIVNACADGRSHHFDFDNVAADPVRAKVAILRDCHEMAEVADSVVGQDGVLRPMGAGP